MESVSDLLGPSAWIVYVLAIFYALYKYALFFIHRLKYSI